ncbi:MAG: putative transporter [Lacipirellulaceae bacterium]
MPWLVDLPQTQPIAHAVGVISLACVVGMSLGTIRVKGVGLGTAGVLFAAILLGHFERRIDHATLDFVKEFGLILFVFTIGLQLGPGFFAALKQQGVRLNTLAATIVLLGAVGAPLLGWLAGFDQAAVIGLFSGATTNTPSLGAGVQTLELIPGVSAERRALPALAYAVTYPAAVAGIIATLVLLKLWFKIDLQQEAAEFAARNQRQRAPLERRTMVVTNPNLEGTTIDAMPARVETEVTISRHRSGERTTVATGATVLQLGDRLTVVGTRKGLDQFVKVVGHVAHDDLVLDNRDVTVRRVVVTSRKALGKTVADLDLDDRFGVAVTRVTRADIEMTAVPGLRMQFGDNVMLVGAAADLDSAARVLGDSLKELNDSHFIPFFLGIFAGVLLGTLPIPVPGLPHPVRLGLAGGPLIAAIALGRVGRIGRLVWHMPLNTNHAFRELGIALFFAAVGIKAGEAFFATVLTTTGLQWLLAGFVLTVVPIVAVGAFARAVLKMNYLDISGLLAGSMTDPPALAFASSAAQSDAPTVAYATVYPLTMLLRILAVQVLAVSLVG